MAELTLFGYRSGHSLLHRIDVRCKLLGLLCISIVSLNASIPSLIILSGLLIFLMMDSRPGFKAFLRQIRYFFVFMLIIIIARTLSTKGAQVHYLYFIPISMQGLSDGLMICWRLFLIVLVGLLFVLTTKPSQIKAAAMWLSAPMPVVSGQRLATMLSLVMRFIPVILNQARQTSEAQKARCVENRKNPVYRLKKIGFPLLRRTFENADRLIFAMEARCYNENQTVPDLSFHRMDWVALSGICALCALFIVI
ncbi:MAG: energy-coupling factor transporter transmembrane protein EcfT [Deltaproteobacteria bacterium]|jgi:energy-coupling factor transporter transmembrane protein EcfT|nr:energy-coupling factor transporter transmembrane protein EcfT [Deltaproteobacteria bacterium]